MSHCHGSKIDKKTQNITLKVNLHCFKLHRSYSVSFNLWNVGKILCGWNDPNSKFRKRKFLLCSCTSRSGHIKLGSFMPQSQCSRETTGKKMYKKVWCRCKVVVCQPNPIAFLPYLLPSLSLLLKLSILLWSRSFATMVYTWHHNSPLFLL